MQFGLLLLCISITCVAAEQGSVDETVLRQLQRTVCSYESFDVEWEQKAQARITKECGTVVDAFMLQTVPDRFRIAQHVRDKKGRNYYTVETAVFDAAALEKFKIISRTTKEKKFKQAAKVASKLLTGTHSYEVALYTQLN